MKPARHLSVWPKPYCCWKCRNSGARVRAVIRIFTGASLAYSCGGWPACGMHMRSTIEECLRSLLSHGPDWKVVAYAVDTDDRDDPVMERELFTARRKFAA